MPKRTDKNDGLARYQAAKKPIVEGITDAKDRFQAAKESDDLRAAEQALSDLSLHGKALKELRVATRSLYLFLDDLSVKILRPQVVELTIPAGVSRIEIIDRALNIAQERSLEDLISWPLRSEWSASDSFRRTSEQPETIRIAGLVRETVGKSLSRTLEILSSKGHTLASEADVSLAYVAYLLVTEGSLFEMRVGGRTAPRWSRVVEGALYRSGSSLLSRQSVPDEGSILLGAAARLP